MKKLISIIAIAAAMTCTASAQGLLGGLFGGGSSSNSDNSNVTTALGGLLEGLVGTVYSAPVSLNGTYVYNGSAVSMTSSEGGVLSNLAGSAVTAGVEQKVDEKLARFGIAPGTMTITFNNTDNTFVWTIGRLSLPGTYKVGDGEQTVTLTFGRTMQFFSMTGNLESSLSGAKILFTANKTAAFLKKVVKQMGESASQLGNLTSLADGYDNFKIGFKLTKQQ